MTAVVAIEGALLAVLLLFVVALLRSHAEILRRLAEFEARPPDHISGGSMHGAGEPGPAADVAGETLSGEVVKVGVGSGDVLLAFLSSGCGGCEPLWRSLDVAPVSARLVTLTKGPERESVSRLRDLAGDAEVLMSSQAWSDYAVPATPHFVHLRDGLIMGRGAANSWDQVEDLLRTADADASTSARAARAEAALAASGVAAGHPSLYPGAEA